jgi:hypothetical protein
LTEPEAAGAIRHLLAGGWVARDDHRKLIQSLTSQQQQFDQRIDPAWYPDASSAPTGQQQL